MNTKCSEHKKLFITGTFLRKARKKIGFSREEIAKKLCVNINIIRDIENDIINSNISATFLRGYIRSYAKLVHLSEKELKLIIKKQSPIELSSKITLVKSVLFIKNKKNKYNLIIRFLWILFFGIFFTFLIWIWKNYHIKEINTINEFNEMN